MRLRSALLTPTAMLVLLSHTFCASAADLVFSGSLIRAGSDSIAVRLPDRRVIEARVPGQRVPAADYKLGDEVQITCKPIQQVWDSDTSSYQFLELTKLRLLRSGPKTADSTPHNPLIDIPLMTAKGPDEPADKKLEHAREVNLQYAADMPNFVADEIAIRYRSEPRSRRSHRVDVIQTEITFKGNQVLRQQIVRNGKPWSKPFQALPGFKWGGFSTEVKPLFSSQCPTTIEYQAPADTNGKKLLEYRFRSPPDGCFSPFYSEYQQYNPARTGNIYIDDPGGNLMRLDEEATGFPLEFEFAERKEEVTWDYVKIGDTLHLLPVKATFAVLYSSGIRCWVEVEYKNHRHFEASTDITYTQ